MTEKEVLAENEPTGEHSKDEKSDKKRSKRPTSGLPNRVIVRRLPPSMTEEEFLYQISPVPKFTAFNFVKPDWTLGIMASSRAYITFEDPEEIFVFRDKYDGYVFVDSKGIEYPAVVEYAPFQGFTKTRSKKRDYKVNTIEADSHFMAFMEALAKAETEIKSESKMEYSYQVKEDTEITSTPLLEYLESKKKEKQAEKKRKQDEKKKKRDDEKQTRKIKLAQKIPEAIKEETSKKEPQIRIEQRKDGKREEKRDEKKRSNNEKKEKPQEKPSTSTKIEADDDGIVVRVVPSRLDRNQRKNKENKEEKDESRRDRKRDRDRKRREENKEKAGNDKNDRGNRDRGDKRQEKPHQPKEKEVIKVLKREVDPKPEEKPQEPKREVKKYSERRKEIRARAENRRNEAEEKVDQTPDSLKASSLLDVSAEPFVPGFKKIESWVVKEGPPDLVEPFPKKTTDEKADYHSESSDKSEKLSKEEEEKRRRERAERISNLRNKDRPSIAIYQPRRVRIAANFDTSENRDGKVKTPESEGNLSDVKGKARDKRRHERRKSHRESGDEKAGRHKKKSVTTEDESREMSRQNSQEKNGSGEETATVEVIEPIVKAVEQLAIKDAEVDS